MNYPEDFMNRIIHGDCLDIIKNIPDKSIDIILTDPPYNVGLEYENYIDKRDDYYDWCDSWFKECSRISDLIIFTPGMVNFNFWMKYQPFWVMCWFKSNQCSYSRIGGFNVWEPILIFGKPKIPIRQDGFNIPIAGQDECSGHPCPKSQRAWTKLILMISKENDLILDPFCGSGTTALICKKNGRRFIGIEQSKKYVEIINRRLSQDYLFT